MKKDKITFLKEQEIDNETLEYINKKIAERNEAKKNKDYVKADIIREELRNHDITIFSFKKSYSDLDSIKTTIKNNYKDNIEWIEISNKGVVVKVKVIERIKKELMAEN